LSRPPRSPLLSLFPYTTLFRSGWALACHIHSHRMPYYLASVPPPSRPSPSEGEGVHHLRRPYRDLGQRMLLALLEFALQALVLLDRKSTRLNSSHEWISYAVFC